jgi:hypothetical protein
VTSEDFRRIALKVRAAKVRVTEENLLQVVGPQDHEIIMQAREASAAREPLNEAPIEGDPQ